MRINGFHLDRVIDSRTNPTVACTLNGNTAMAPAGASAGSHEASCFVPDNLEEIEDAIHAEVREQDLSLREFDATLAGLDGTQGFDRIGSVSIAASLAFKAASGYDRDPVFPYPLGNIVGGGEHGGNTAIQEFLVLPVEATSFPEAVHINSRIYQEMKERYESKILGMNDEGALVTRMDDEETLEKLSTVAEEHGARLGLDVAANELWDGSVYRYPSMNMELTPREQLKFMQKLTDEYDLAYVEDPFHEDDFQHHQQLRRETDTLVVGDDLFVTDADRLQRGIDEGAGNSIIIKPNQIGTVSATRRTVRLAQDNDYTPVLSHRSGETTDTSIADLALEWNVPILKAGVADIRIAKLNHLILAWERMDRRGREPEMAEVR